uniref:Chitin-binding type-2 domain-containing protein n=1 Tax=Tetranychus urticae TaxID=32264 RepID=T1KPZ3_TETUR
MKTMILIILFIISLIPLSLQECIRFEFHEKIESTFGQSDLIRAMCIGKGGRIIDYSLQMIQLVGPSIFNVTFHCCAPSYCLSDHDCPINFNCKNGICSVAECILTDEPEIVLQESRECFIDDDCYFDIPFDSDNWRCLPDPWCFHNKSCDNSYNFCKRCPTGYIDADPKRFTDGTVQPPTTSSPWWLTPSSIPNNDPDVSSYFGSTDQPINSVHHEHSVPNNTETTSLVSSFDTTINSTPITRTVTTSTTSETPEPITVGFDELSPNGNNSETGFGASDLPINLSDDELITNVSVIDLARIDSVDEIGEALNSTEFSTPQPPISTSISSSPSSPDSSSNPSSSLSPSGSDSPSNPSSPSSPLSSESSYNPPLASLTSVSSHNLNNFESRPFVTANPFAWAGLFEKRHD